MSCLIKSSFEATVLNEMSSLIEKGIEDFEGTVDIVMGTLVKILDYNVAVIVVLEEHDIECVFKINNSVSEQYLNDVREHTKNYLNANDIYLPSSNKMTIFGKDKIKQARVESGQKSHILTCQ